MSGQKGRLRKEDEVKIQRNYTYLLDELDGKDLTDIMFSRGVFDMDCLDEIQNVKPYTRRQRTEKFLEKLMFSGENGYKVFLESLDRSYPHVSKQLESKDVSHEFYNDKSEDWIHDVPNERMQQKITDKELSRLVQSLGNGWEFLAYELNLTKVQVEQVKMGNSLPHGQMFSVLTKWRQRQGAGATFGNMMKALTSVKGCTIDWDIVEKVVKGEPV